MPQLDINYKVEVIARPSQCHRCEGSLSEGFVFLEHFGERLFFCTGTCQAQFLEGEAYRMDLEGG